MKSDLQILSAIEWVFDWEADDDLCPECENFRYQGHKQPCEFGALLGRLRNGGLIEVQVAKLEEVDPRSDSAIRAALEQANNNGAEAARMLGIPLRTFRRYMSRMGLKKKFA